MHGNSTPRLGSVQQQHERYINAVAREAHRIGGADATDTAFGLVDPHKFYPRIKADAVARIDPSPAEQQLVRERISVLRTLGQPIRPAVTVTTACLTAPACRLARDCRGSGARCGARSRLHPAGQHAGRRRGVRSRRSTFGPSAGRAAPSACGGVAMSRKDYSQSPRSFAMCGTSTICPGL